MVASIFQIIPDLENDFVFAGQNGPVRSDIQRWSLFGR